MEFTSNDYLLAAEYVENVIQDNQGTEISKGLCKLFQEEISFGLEPTAMDAYTELKNLIDFSKYPEFSGNMQFPVPAPKTLNKAMKEVDLEKHERDDPELWYEHSESLWIGEYGQNRIKFCNWCGEELRRIGE